MFQSAIIDRLLKGFDPIHVKTVQLKKGQIFQGSITKIYPGHLAQLRLGKMVLTAKLEASLEKGKQYWFRVTGSDGLPKLKVLEYLPSITQTNEQLQSSDGKSFSSFIQQLNLPQTELMKELLTRFIQQNIPFSRDVLLQGSEVIEQSSLSNREGIQLFMHMLKWNIPVTKETFFSMASLFSNESIGEAVEKLYNHLSNTNGHEKYHSLMQLLKVFYQVKLNDNDEKHISNFEQPLINYKEDGREGRITNFQDEKFLINNLFNVQQGNKITNVSMLKQLFQLLGLQHEFNVRLHLQNESNELSFQTLKAQLLLFLKDTNHSDEFSQIRNTAQFLVNRITALQLMSIDAQQPLQQVVIQIPLFFPSTPKDVTIQWEGKEGKNGQIDEEYCRILFYLQLEHLKETVVDVQIQNRVITVNIYNDNPRPSELIDMWLPMLKENLLKINYQLSNVKWIESKEKWSEPEKSPLPMLQDDGIYRRVDVRI